MSQIGRTGAIKEAGENLVIPKQTPADRLTFARIESKRLETNIGRVLPGAADL